MNTVSIHARNFMIDNVWLSADLVELDHAGNDFAKL